MSNIIKVNKSQLSTATNDIKTKVKSLSEVINSLTSSLESIPSHSDFSSLTTKTSMLANSLKNIYVDYDILSNNMDTYVTCIKDIDAEGIDGVDSVLNQSNDDGIFNDGVGSSVVTEEPKNNDVSSPLIKDNQSGSIVAAAVGTLSTGGNDWTPSNTGTGKQTYSYSTGPSGTVVYTNNFSSNALTSSDYEVAPGGKYNYKGIEKYLENIEGVTVNVPSGLGSVHTYMGWQCITAKDSKQYKLIEAAGMNFDEEGFAKIGDRYVVAVTTTFGNVGDFIDVYKEDGSVIKCVIGDIKSRGDAGCTEWGHNNGTNVVEFVVDKNSWYGSRMHSNPGTSSCHPEWNQNVTKIVNKGNFFELIKTDAAKMDSDSSETNSTNLNELVDKLKTVEL